ncbi:unnamed protein product [Prorocentrum cordatum]|uniref:Uncharacterized protein n=1 Tax=Prorocentrum cordatum TaxID=2364126 RepID=A0ABN9S9V0_9DINO|nr:unnamed protein product [Polarella glacialis]
MAVCLCTCVKTACFPTDEKPFFEAAADGPARKMTRLRLRARLRAPRRVEARAPDPPLPPGRGQVGQTAKVSGEGEADEQEKKEQEEEEETHSRSVGLLPRATGGRPDLRSGGSRAELGE